MQENMNKRVVTHDPVFFKAIPPVRGIMLSLYPRITQL